MEKDNNKQDLEKYVRQELEHIDTKPDADTWAKIAAQQRPLNLGLQFRFYGLRTLLLCGIAVSVWFFWQQYSPAAPTTPVPGEAIPFLHDGASVPAEQPVEMPTSETSLVALQSVSGASAQQKRPDWYHHNTVPGQQVRFMAEKGIQYQSPVSGNKVQIPAGVLVYQDGKPVTGSVDLFFREYRDMADFLAAGMPMHYGDDRGAFFFNSGGMFEVRVSQNGADLFVAPGKKYNIDFTPTRDLRDATLYYLPDATNEWAHVPHGQQALEDTVGLSAILKPRVLSENEVAADNLKAADLSCLPAIWAVPDTADAVTWLQQAILDGRAYAHGEIQPPIWFRKNAERDDLFFLRGLDRSDIRIVHRYDTEERFFPDDLDNKFTELAAFKECYFTRLSDSSDMIWRPDPNNSVDQMFRQHRNWKRVTVYPQKGAECMVVFGDDGDEIKVPARLSRSSNRSLSTPFNPSVVFAEYEQLRKARQKAYTDSIKRWRKFVAIADMHQTPKEWCMPMKIWFEYFEKNKKVMQQRYDALCASGITTDRAMAQAAITEWRERIRQMHFDRIALESKNQTKANQMAMSLSVSGFGTYNWDQIFQLAGGMSKEKYLYPKYQTLGGEAIAPMATRIIDHERQLFFSLPKSNSLLRLPGRVMDVVVTAMNGRTYFLAGKTYAGLALEGVDEYTFTVEDVTDRVGSPIEWARLLGI